MLNHHLTDANTNKLQDYYGKAIRALPNVGNVEGGKKKLIGLSFTTPAPMMKIHMITAQGQRYVVSLYSCPCEKKNTISY